MTEQWERVIVTEECIGGGLKARWPDRLTEHCPRPMTP
jgi:hypothetical protein